MSAMQADAVEADSEHVQDKVHADAKRTRLAWDGCLLLAVYLQFSRRTTGNDAKGTASTLPKLLLSETS